jgi:ribosomal protein L35
MPKMKSKSSAKKRFTVRAGGTIKRGQAFKRHILTKKTTKNKQLQLSVSCLFQQKLLVKKKVFKKKPIRSFSD